VVVDGPPLDELPRGTRLAVGSSVVLVLGSPVGGRADGDAPDGGLREGSGAACPARVDVAGVIRVGDPVVIEAVPLALDDALDLHPFRPDDVAAVVQEYLRQARVDGLTEVRLIHGRGRGVQRETVRRILRESPLVAAFADAPPERGGWGATVVRLLAGAEPADP